MIDIMIAPDALVCGRATEVVISVANRSSRQSAYSVVVEFEPDHLIRLDSGDCRIEIDELRPGAVDDGHRVTLTGRVAGVGRVEFPYVSYWTHDGRPMRLVSSPISIRVDPQSEPELPNVPSPSAVTSEPYLPAVFISHRHEDSDWLGQHLRSSLASHLSGSRVFLDYDDLAPGDVWRAVLDRELRRANALLALIGPSWETLADEKGVPRLQLPHDVVRYEIATALQRQILVIPVLHGRKTLPHARDLPLDLLPLRERQYVHVHHKTQRHIIRDIAIRLRGAGLF